MFLICNYSFFLGEPPFRIISWAYSQCHKHIYDIYTYIWHIYVIYIIYIWKIKYSMHLIVFNASQPFLAFEIIGPKFSPTLQSGQHTLSTNILFLDLILCTLTVTPRLEDGTQVWPIKMSYFPDHRDWMVPDGPKH